MLSKKIVFLLIPVIINSCGVTTGNIANPNGSNSTVNTSIGTLNFSKVQDSKLAEYNNLLNRNLSGVNSTGASDSSMSRPMPAPSMAPESKMVAPGADIAMRYFPPYGGGGFWEEYAVIDFEEAKQNGFTGTYLEALNKVVKPIISQLASDTRLVNTSGSSDLGGTNKVSEETKKLMPYMDYQWYFNFVSSSKKEVYSINISEKEVLVLRQRWGLKNLEFENIKIDSKDAIRIFSDAVKNKDLKSTDNQEQYISPNSEILYDIPKENTSWYLYLENDKNNLVWSVSMNINYNYPMPAVMSSDTTVSSGGSVGVASATPYIGPSYWYSGGYARVDANTGKLLNFTRPVKYTNNVVEPYPTKEPYPPTATATAMPVPTSTPTDTATSSPSF